MKTTSGTLKPPHGVGLSHWPAPLIKVYGPCEGCALEGISDAKSYRNLGRLYVYKEVKKICENPERIEAIGASNWNVSYLERPSKHAAVPPEP